MASVRLRSQYTAPLDAAIYLTSLNWDGNALAKDELPPELLTSRESVLIFLLPRVLKALDCPMASDFVQIWQYGSGKHKVRSDTRLPGSQYYVEYQLKEFSSSATLDKEMILALTQTISILPNLGEPNAIYDSVWRSLLDELRPLKKRDKWPVVTEDYRGKVFHPKVAVLQAQIDTMSYISSGESPRNSDAYATLGPCGIRTYLHAEVSKKPGDEKLYVRPKRVGARIWDDFNFNDRLLDRLTGLILTSKASQFLGSWRNSSDGSVISLSNEDFKKFSTEFKSTYNSYLNSRRDNRARLACNDFHSVSNYVEWDVPGAQEYGITIVK